MGGRGVWYSASCLKEDQFNRLLPFCLWGCVSVSLCVCRCVCLCLQTKFKSSEDGRVEEGGMSSTDKQKPRKATGWQEPYKAGPKMGGGGKGGAGADTAGGRKEEARGGGKGRAGAETAGGGGEGGRQKGSNNTKSYNTKSYNTKSYNGIRSKSFFNVYHPRQYNYNK